MKYAHLVRAVIHKKLWIGQVVHALTVAPGGLVHALTVAGPRINGRAPSKEPVVPSMKRILYRLRRSPWTTRWVAHRQHRTHHHGEIKT